MNSCDELEVLIKKTKDYFTEYNTLVWNISSSSRQLPNNNSMDLDEKYYIDYYFLQEYLTDNYRVSGFNVEEYTENNEKVSRITLPKIVIPEFKIGTCNLGETLSPNTINNIANEIKSKLKFRLYWEDEDHIDDYYYDFDSTESDDLRIKIGNPLKGISTKKVQEGINKGIDQVKKGVGQVTNPILDPIKDTIKSTGKAASKVTEKLPKITIDKPKVSVDDIKNVVSIDQYNSLLSQVGALTEAKNYLKKLNEDLNKQLTDTQQSLNKAQNKLGDVQNELDAQKKLLNKISENITKEVVNTLSKAPVPCLAARKTIAILGVEARYPTDYSSVINKILNIAQKAAMAEISMVIASSIPTIVASGGSTLPGVLGIAITRGLKAFRESITNSLQLINETGISSDIIKIKEINESSSGEWISITNPSSLASVL